MSEVRLPTSAPRRLAQASTWGNPRRTRTPRFERLMMEWAKACNAVLFGVAASGIVAIVILVLVLAFGTQFSRLYASDGSMFSCEIPLRQAAR
jgi:hypothetical protein